jgi:hypothetical protein
VKRIKLTTSTDQLQVSREPHRVEQRTSYSVPTTSGPTFVSRKDSTTLIKILFFDELMLFQNNGGWRMDQISIPNLVKNGLFKSVFNKVKPDNKEPVAYWKNKSPYVYKCTIRFCICDRFFFWQIKWLLTFHTLSQLSDWPTIFAIPLIWIEKSVKTLNYDRS